ncbi:MAG: Gfo/Idh/MocA family oxidoreductase [Candidatus Cloacimonetes bacterium]|nr:Gfo/Idh/MocA family oxidoreductase [Candidatus Cloacimonadota bacterium]
MKPVTFLIVGAGDRGFTYAQYAEHFPDRMKIVGVAEPCEYQRQRMAEMHHIPSENTLTNWLEAIDKERFADAVIISTQDALHYEPAVAFARKGYHILLEKPMAPTAEECRNIVREVKKQQVCFAVCHVLRYTAYTQKLKQILSEGVIGDIISLQHLEPVGYWHQAHSFVRGNWGNEQKSTFMLLAKSCHDLDWIRYIIGEKCRRLSSFGSLNYFTKANQPSGAAGRCLDCPEQIESRCAYSARKIYLGFLEQGIKGWPLSVLTPEPDKESITRALREGDYGRCVFDCDNDVVDHQVVNMEFDQGKTATFTMTAFTKAAGRKTRIFGTQGELEGDGNMIKIFDFRTDKLIEIDTRRQEGILQGHGGGDLGIIRNFVDALQSNDASRILTGADESLETHLMVFKAEESRHKRQIMEVE